MESVDSMSNIHKTSKRSSKSASRPSGKGSSRSRRGVEPPHDPGNGRLTLITPVDDSDVGHDKIRIEYLTESPENEAASQVAPEDAAAQVAAALAGDFDQVEPSILSARAESLRVDEPESLESVLAEEDSPESELEKRELEASAPSAVPPPASYVPIQPLLFEVSWEVCWQLGGIYTVIRSKAPQMSRIWGDRYCLIGPYNQDTADVELEECQPTGPIAIAVERLRHLGIKVHHGHWLITGRPRVILLEFGAALERLAEFTIFPVEGSRHPGAGSRPGSSQRYFLRLPGGPVFRRALQGTQSAASGAGAVP